MKNLCAEIKPYVKELASMSCSNNNIKPEMYLEHNVKRGLRDLDGNGVVTGLTEISHIKAKEKGPDGESVPCEGELYFRGYNVRDLVDGFHKSGRFGFEEAIYLLLFSELPSKDALAKFKELLAEYRSLPQSFV
ncbi:MAG: citrate synthase, partial [Ruminococcaceae bacterium]|nr:citrate synthase [Oscillospiraceae bacterium]